MGGKMQPASNVEFSLENVSTSALTSCSPDSPQRLLELEELEESVWWNMLRLVEGMSGWKPGRLSPPSLSSQITLPAARHHSGFCGHIGRAAASCRQLSSSSSSSFSFFSSSSSSFFSFSFCLQHRQEGAFPGITGRLITTEYAPSNASTMPH